MAQNTGADSLIAPKAKTASARVILALAVAVALAVSGCGGGSGGSTASTSTSSPGTSAQAPGADPSGSGTSSSSSSSSSSSGQAPGSGPDSPNPSEPQVPGSTSGSGKHGQHIKAPKGAPEPAPTPAEEAQATVADITLASPELQSAEGAVASITPTYTCDGKGSSPGLAWRGIPAGTAELALFAMNSQPVGGKLFFDWAVAGIDPSLEGIDAGTLPKGAVVGQNSFGKTDYEICPPKGSPETYIFALYALPKWLAAAKGFEPHQLREAILDVSGNVGLMAAVYARQ
jgi:phosphatidylethanolamine-binding protein (PEBP) family uncharacterized protein